MLPTTLSSPAGNRDPGLPAVSLPVPPGCLVLPPVGDRRRILGFESALFLDRSLRRLSRLSGAMDRGLALRLLQLRRTKGYLRLGQACFGDYVRERVGVAQRTAQEWVRLGRGLQRLPSLDAALQEGRLTWTAAAQIARVASIDDQAQWVASAELLSVRDLKSRVTEELRKRKAVGRSSPRAPDEDSRPAGNSGDCELDSGPLGDGSDREDRAVVDNGNDHKGSVARDNGNDHEGSVARDDGNAGTTDLFEMDANDRPVKLRLFTSKRTAHLWEAALELCELTAGSPLSPAEGPEYILADFLSGTLPAGDDVRAFPIDPPLKHDARVLPGNRPPRSIAVAQLADELGDRRVEFTSAELSREVRRVLELLESDLPQDPFLLDEQVQALMAARRGLDLDLARMLRTFKWLGLARHIGFRNFTSYVEERLALSAERARFLVRLDRSLTGLHATRQAVRQGRVGAVAAMLVARVASDDEIESAWLERAQRVTVLRLRKEVQWAERRNAERGVRVTPPPSLGPLPSALQTLTMGLLANGGKPLHPFEGSHAWLRCRGTAAQGGTPQPTNRETFAHRDSSGTPEIGNTECANCETSAHRDSSGTPEIGKSDCADCEMFARRDLSSTPEIGQTGCVSCETSPHFGPTSGQDHGNGFVGHVDGPAMAEAMRYYRELFVSDDGPEGTVPVEFWMRRSALNLWTEARRRLAVAAGQTCISDREVLHEIVLAFLFTHLRAWLEAVQQGDPTAVRDRFVCQVPGCTLRAGSGHHLRFRSDLGPDDPWNLLFVCWGHHLLGIHGGPWIRVTGRAPDALKAELGLLPGGHALETWVRGRPMHSATADTNFPRGPSATPSGSTTALSGLPRNGRANARR